MTHPRMTETDEFGKSNHEWIDTGDVSVHGSPAVVDLFAGCGGFSLGLIAAGFRVALAVEFDRWAAATFRRNHRGVPLLQRDIRGIGEGTIRRELGDLVPEVIVAGPPCQGFSTAGEGSKDDPRNRLYQQVVRFVEMLRPAFVVIENVKGILRPKLRPVLEEALRGLAEIGYENASVLVLNAADYGVPQTRERVFVIANRLGLPNSYPAPVIGDGDHPPVLPTIEDLQDVPRTSEISHDWPIHDGETVRRLERLEAGESLHGKQAWRRLHSDRPAFTMTHNNGIPAVHPVEPRSISAREMARLQTFPDDFRFRGLYQKAERMIGNAVPPRLGEHIGRAIARRDLADGGTREAVSEDMVRRRTHVART